MHKLNWLCLLCTLIVCVFVALWKADTTAAEQSMHNLNIFVESRLFYSMCWMLYAYMRPCVVRFSLPVLKNGVCEYWWVVFSYVCDSTLYYAAAVQARSSYKHLSVCLAVRLSNVWIMTKRKHLVKNSSVDYELSNEPKMNSVRCP